MPFHPKAASFLRQNLFLCVSKFAQLEKRIEALPDEQMRGDAFEVFAEAYLATQRKHDASEVWPLTSTPAHVLSALGLTTRDQGVDGVFKTVLGQLNAYQVKFRTNRPALTWHELSTFIGLADSPQISSRVLFTNVDDLPAVLNQRHGFFCIRGSDLDRLEAEDFRAIEAWLAETVYSAQKKRPLPHQTEALDALLPALESHDRVSAIMACGTGKTLIALWVAEHRKPSRILVLVPSLALLRQILHEWLRETNLTRLAYLCVCSDATVKEGMDALETKQSDLDFEVSTDPESVRGFLNAPFDGTKVVFSTYQSAPVVGSAMAPGEFFDFAVFDEAHKTAGRQGRNYAFALENTNLSIRKRLFLTATPRHYNPHRGNDDTSLVFSMDNPEVYGVQAYRLTFAEAARREIICGYKVIISAITSEMVSDHLLSNGEVLVNGDLVKARQVANQIALKDAVEKYGAKKVFTFHKTVASAASFVAVGNEGIGSHLADFQLFHVNGTMPTARRENQMRDFRSAPQAIMSNARCLTEGVDVPAVDMVAFLSPRRSRVDIVQATGRAMRRSPNKTTGYVLVPLYVELAAGETVEAAVKRAEFTEVWDVLNSLQEQDNVLADLIRYVGEQKRQGLGFDDSRFGDRVDFSGSNIGLESLRAAITTRCFEALYSSWDAWFGKLKAFKDQFGHCNLQSGVGDESLRSWVSSQRIQKKKGILSENRIKLLESIGFVWDFQAMKGEKTWFRWYQELEMYQREHGNADVPRTHVNTKLASWVWIQRIRRNKPYGKVPKLTDMQIAHLDKLGFRWDIRNERFAEKLEQLRQFKEHYGHCEVGAVPGTDVQLVRWVATQRNAQSQGTLDVERKEQLDALGFSWIGEVNDYKWDEMYIRLRNFYNKQGHSDVPSRWEDDQQLANWITTQRSMKKKKALPDNQARLLDELGFAWQHRERGSWEDRLSEIVEFKAKNGHCDIPIVYPENPRLGRFVNTMRVKRNNGSLPSDRISQLDAIGFYWKSPRKAHAPGEVISAAWKKRLDELIAYKEIYGNCEVPTNWPENPLLGRWVSQQRQNRKNGVLNTDREQMLAGVGFNWGGERKKNSWAENLAKLKEYKLRFGDWRVPTKWAENPELGCWVANVRSRRKRGKLSEEQEQLFREIGFE